MTLSHGRSHHRPCGNLRPEIVVAYASDTDPPTILWALGGTAPAQYQGRVLNEAFVTELISA